MLKAYREKAPAQEEYVYLTLMVAVEKQAEEFPPCNDMSGESDKLRNLHNLANFKVKIQHLSASKQAQFSSLVNEFTDLSSRCAEASKPP